MKDLVDGRIADVFPAADRVGRRQLAGIDFHRLGRQVRGQLRVDRPSLIEQQQNHADDQRRGERPDQNGVLLELRRCPKEVPGLECLRGRTAVAAGNADDAGNRQCEEFDFLVQLDDFEFAEYE
jgi:hypothetical protein